MTRPTRRALLLGLYLSAVPLPAAAQRVAVTDDFLGLTRCEDGRPVTRLRSDVRDSLVRAQLEAHEAVHREQARGFPACEAFLASLGSARRIIDVELPAYCEQWRVAVGQGADPVATRRDFAWRISAQSGAMENRLQVLQRFERECDLVGSRYSWRTGLALATTLTATGPAGSDAAAQTAEPVVLEASTARVALLPVALYTAQANLQEASDSAVATLATSVLTQRLGDLLGEQLAPPERVAPIATAPAARSLTGGQACNVIVACARLVGRELQTPWVVMAKVSKTSNLIWLFTGQLIQTSTGAIILDDSTELKGEPQAMVLAGSRIFAERVARTVRDGGRTTDFPDPQ